MNHEPSDEVGVTRVFFVVAYSRVGVGPQPQEKKKNRKEKN
jgi:hypothetical protein